MMSKANNVKKLTDGLHDNDEAFTKENGWNTKDNCIMTNHEKYSLSYDAKESSVVYCCKNIVNNKTYIGYTQTSLYRRKISHYASSRKNTSNNYFKSALSKYKESDFLWFVLFRSNSLDELKEREKFFIKLFKSNNRLFGYNLSSGGEQCFFNEEVRNKISKKAKSRGLDGEQNPFYGKHHSSEQRKKWSESRKGVIFNPGYKHTEEIKKRLSEIRKEICKNQNVIYNMSIAQKSKPIKCINTGISFRSIGEAARNLKLNKGTIQAHLKGRLKSAKGYVFIYE